MRIVNNPVVDEYKNQGYATKFINIPKAENYQNPDPATHILGFGPGIPVFGADRDNGGSQPRERFSRTV